MLNLLDNGIKHLPNKRISQQNLMYLGYSDNYDIVLAVEEWEFRIYNYEFWSEDSIYSDHEDEDWRTNVNHYFWTGSDCFDMDTCEYVVAKFENDNPLDMASELILACDVLEDVSHRISDEWVPTDELIQFMKHWLMEIAKYNGALVYGYYK